VTTVAVSPVVGSTCSANVPPVAAMAVVTTPHSAVISTWPPATVNNWNVIADSVGTALDTGPRPSVIARSSVP